MLCPAKVCHVPSSRPVLFRNVAIANVFPKPWLYLTVPFITQ